MQSIKRIRIEIEGIVQGVGFRPFVFRLADRHKISGWVQNSTAGVTVEAEGNADHISSFLADIEREAPPLAVISAVRSTGITPEGGHGFAILQSGTGEGTCRIAPDSDVCPDCLRELFDPANRRYRYPFINCTNCGPRYSIITGIPYDRSNTTMSGFTMCPDCRAEYENPRDRRFHAQPVACPACGPHLTLRNTEGEETTGDPIEAAISLLKNGEILAVKGIGGYHLAVDACNDDAVAELRRRKKRDEKPFALMAPTIAEVRRFACFDDMEERLLNGPEHPIVLLRKREDSPVSPLVAPANGYFGTMLPYTPLHHLLLRDNFTALVMTSGNLSDEPIAYLDDEARERLAEIADFFLANDREIHTRTDDSVIRVFQGAPLFLRRSRGYVPREVRLPAPQPRILAVGAELKGTVCLTTDNRAFMSQHIGDLKNAPTLRSLEDTVGHLSQILDIRPQIVAHDLHPDYLSTAYAEGIDGLPRVAVQHHHAHMAACMAENGIDGEVIGAIFDGTGFGPDQTVWGGEFLVGGYSGYRRAGHFRQVPLPGGDAAVRETFRMAFAYLHDTFGSGLFDLSVPWLAEIMDTERKLYLRMLERRINSPLTSSCGRLFDAVAAIIGLRRQVTYEGQAAIELEAMAEEHGTNGVYPFSIMRRNGSLSIDFRMMIHAIVDDLAMGRPGGLMARMFHNTVAAATVDMCKLIRSSSSIKQVVLSGGSFQNRLLTEEIHRGLTNNGFEVFTHRLVPPNDGGLALGQAIIAGRSNICV